MPRSLEELVAVLDLEEIEIGLYRGACATTSLQRTYGGQVLAQAVMAAYRTVGADRVLHSLNAYFLRPGRADNPIIYDVETTRDGGTISSRRVLARQGGKVIFSLSASFHTPEVGLDHGDPMPDGVPPAEACPDLGEVLAARFGGGVEFWHEWADLDLRYAGHAGRGGDLETSAHGAHLRVWVRLRGTVEDDLRLHQAATAYLSDLTLLSVTTMPHDVVFTSPRLQAATIDHSMWFHRPVRADRWLLYDQVSPSASSGLGLASGRLFQDGVLVASCSQEGLIRLVGEPGHGRAPA